MPTALASKRPFSDFGFRDYFSSTFYYSDTAPAVSGTGNISINPLLLGDAIHLSANSPCIGAGLESAVTGVDIDGQPWKNPPSIGCDEWQTAPIIVAPPSFQATWPALDLNFSVAASGQGPLSFLWIFNGAQIQASAHYNNVNASNLVVNNFGPGDSGSYQFVVSNASGSATSAVVNVAIHGVSAAGLDPVPPYESWSTAATNIQDAIEAAFAGDIVLVTNGIYNAGGEVMAGMSNRVALDKALTVLSVNGWTQTIIEGAWDPVSTNGPGAVRCAWLTNGAILSGFTLQNGATLSTGTATNSRSGGGVWCVSTNALVSNCLLSNNFASYGGGGFAFGTLNNSLVVYGVAEFGGGAYEANLNNCTVQYNFTTGATPLAGGGTYGGAVANCIVVGNYDGYPFTTGIDNYGTFEIPMPQISYSCTYNQGGPNPSGPGNISADPQLLDGYHISLNSPCRGAGSALYASGYDLDGESWSTAPSIGCDEVVVSNRVGSLSVSILPFETNVLVSSPSLPHADSFFGRITGLASYVTWNYGDGPTTSNAGATTSHYWTNAGDYNVVLTAYNLSNPSGVSSAQVIHVLPVNPPQLQAPSLVSNVVQFQFMMQAGAFYTVRYATNLTPPVTWLTLENIYDSPGGVAQIQDSSATNAARFYQVEAQ